MFSVNIIPFTVSKSTIGEINVRNKVNIETDIIGKYIESFVDKVSKKEITMNLLYEQGFIKGE